MDVFEMIDKLSKEVAQIESDQMHEFLVEILILNGIMIERQIHPDKILMKATKFGEEFWEKEYPKVEYETKTN